MADYVLVLNHFAVPVGAAGGTRHVEMFSGLSGEWEAVIVAADLNLLDRSRTKTDDQRFRLVWTTPYATNGPARVLNWLSYALGATFIGLTGPRPAVVYASSPHLLAGLAGWIVARVRRSGFVLEIRDLWPRVLVEMGRLSEGSVTYRVLRALERRLYRAADAIVVLAEGSEAVIREDVGVAKQIEFIPNGADVDRFASVEPDQTRTPLVFLYAGAHGPANGLELLLDAAEEMQARRVDVIIRLLGDGVSKARLVTDASRRGLANVEFVDPVPKDAIPAQMAEASVGLHVLADVPMFRYGVSPNKLFEYMAAGLPVITNTPGEVSHLVEASDGGFAVDPRGLTDGIERMAELAPEARAQLGQHGRDWVTRERDRKRIADTLESLLRSVGR